MSFNGGSQLDTSQVEVGRGGRGGGGLGGLGGRRQGNGDRRHHPDDHHHDRPLTMRRRAEQPR